MTSEKEIARVELEGATVILAMREGAVEADEPAYRLSIDRPGIAAVSTKIDDHGLEILYDAWKDAHDA